MMRVPKLAFIQTSFSGLQRWCSSARLIWWLITLPFHFPLSFLKPLSNKPVHDLPICSGELGRQKARFCCLGCKVARFPVLDKGVMHQKIQVLVPVCLLAMFWFESCHPHIPIKNLPVINALVTKLTRLARCHQHQVKVANTGLTIARGFAIFLRSLVRQCYLAIGESGSLGVLV